MSGLVRGRLSSRIGVLGVAVVAAVSAFVSPAAAQAPQEPGVTLRTYQFAQRADEDLHAQVRPDAERRQVDADHRLDDRRPSSAPRRQLPVHRAGEPEHRDGRRATPSASRATTARCCCIDGNVVIDHDGLHGDTSKDGAVTLTAGCHDLRIDYIEAGDGQVLKLEWRAPGSSSFVVVPSSVALHRGRRRPRHRPGQQVLRGRDRHGRRRPAPGHGQPELRPDRHPPRRASSRRSRAWTSCRTAAWS